jgi:hypothetical protein
MMISPNDVLQIISEIHQYSMLLVEFRDETTFGIQRSTEDKLCFFKIVGKLGKEGRAELARRLSVGEMPESLRVLTFDEFLHDVECKRAKHIWLESAGLSRKELGFLSISELKSHFRTHARR